MITKPTVLILGAGASIPFGFPSGYDLMRRLCRVSPYADSDSIRVHLASAGYDARALFDFRQALQRSGRRSVDAFLEHRPDFLGIGKAAIACALLPFENESALFDLDKHRPHWYEYLFDRMDMPVTRFEKNKISIITFNYDRTLEHYLVTALANSYKGSAEECAAAVQKIPIIHVYGSLGDLPLLGQTVVPFGAAPTPETLARCSVSLRLMHEGAKDPNPFHEAYVPLMAAEVVCFLGFGYDQMNLTRLRVREIRAKTVIGSAYGLTAKECEPIANAFGGRIELDYAAGESLTFLRNHTPLY